MITVEESTWRRVTTWRNKATIPTACTRYKHHVTHRQRYFDDEERRHHDYEHEGGALGVPELPAVGLLLVVLVREQDVSALLGEGEGAEEEHVQDDEGYAGRQVDEHYAEEEVEAVVAVHCDVALHPVRGGHAADVLGPVVPEDFLLGRQKLYLALCIAMYFRPKFQFGTSLAILS